MSTPKPTLFTAETEDQTRVLLAAGADPNARGLDGLTPLHRAESVDQTRALLASGANPNLRDSEGRTPLHFARDVDQTRALLAAGANPNPRDVDGQTPLHEIYDADCTRVLLEHGANPNAPDADGRTPLLLAHPAKARALLAAGADPLLAYPPGTRIKKGCLDALCDPEVVAALKPQTASRLVDAHPYLADLAAKKPEVLLARAAAENRMAERLARPSLAARIAEHAVQPAPERDAPGIER